MATPVLRPGYNAGLTLIRSKPSGTVSGDLMLVSVCSVGIDASGSLAPTITAPSGAGWVQLVTMRSASVAQSSARRFTVWYKVAGPSEPASWTWTTTGGDASSQILSLGGVNPAALFDGAGSSQNAAYGSTNAVTGGSVTPVLGGGLLVLLQGYTDTDFVAGGIPAGMTRAGFYDGSPKAVADLQAVGAGATGTRTSALGATPTWVASHMFVVAGFNTAPTAPALISPPAGAALDRAVTNRFSWTFTDPDVGDTQSQYTFERRLGAGAWAIATTSTPNAFIDIAAGTLALGSHEWRVKTKDAQGLASPYSTIRAFTVADVPTDLTITAPITGATVTGTSTTVAWSTPDQDAWEARTVADLAGAPDTATVYTFSVGESATDRQTTLTFGVTGRYEHIQVRVREAGLWSAWVSVRVLVSFTPPPVPTVTATASTDGYILVQPVVPASVSPQPVTASVDLYRRVTGDGDRIAAGLAPSLPYRDYRVAHRQDYQYRVLSVGVNGGTTWSEWSASVPGALVVTESGVFVVIEEV